MAVSKTLRIFGGSSHPGLTELVSRKVGVRAGQVSLSRFANGETRVELEENVRGAHVFVLQTGGSCTPNDHLMELLLLIQALKASAADHITLIAPFLFYSKGDQRAGLRVPIACKLVAELVERAGASHVMLLEPHTAQVEGFFASPVDALCVEPLFCDWITHNVANWRDAVVVSADEGAVKRSVGVANDLGLDFAIVHGRKKHNRRQHRRAAKISRDEDNQSSRSMSKSSSSSQSACLSGTVENRVVVIIDDMIDTGKTMRRALEIVRREGATQAYFMATHGIMASDEALANIRAFDTDFLKAVVVTNSIDQTQNRQRLSHLHVVDVSNLIAEYVRRHHYKESVSVLSQFMPVVDEHEQDDSDSQEEEYEVREGAEGQEEQPEERAVDRRPHSFRKGFRLSSVCWD